MSEETDLTERSDGFYEGEREPMYYQNTRDYFEPSYPSAESSRHPSSERFHQILGSLGDLHDQKQRDYGTSSDPFANVRASEDFGIPAWVGAILRANDKMRRLMTAINQYLDSGEAHLVNESIEDSFDDLAVYVVIARVLYEEETETP